MSPKNGADTSDWMLNASTLHEHVFWPKDLHAEFCAPLRSTELLATSRALARHHTPHSATGNQTDDVVSHIFDKGKAKHPDF